MGDSTGKSRSKLIIIDRSFDITSLILHELTFQAMAYDNFPIRNDVFTFNENKVQKHVFFDQRDKLWNNIRHQHISTAVITVSEKLKKCVNSLRASAAATNTANGSSVGTMSNAIKAIPIQKKKSEKFSIFMSVLKNCMDFYGEHLEEICVFEQDLVMGETATGEKIKYNIKEKLTYFLKKENVSVQNKIRLIILYILCEDGVPKDIFNELVQNAQLSPAQVQTITNLNMLGVTTITDGERQKRSKPERKQRVDENTFQVSRWTPLIKDLMENIVENKLNPDQFPSVGAPIDIHKPSSSRYTGQNVTWYKGKDSTKHLRSRVILFVLGGVTYSEMRCAYEISKSSKNCEIVIGSSHPLTAMDFIQELSKLDKP
ncbi:syntaxin-binding protein 1-like [Rhopalosiphum padi]|uniref:syntaxin-binding protein 1-like n=1 Tax=Rhopalosiphum padi TaxID=40932 RepID=UPI00298EB6E9|nr:syntaxin-binding protein 1-like [Rhopalosiphum padi]